MRSVKEESCTVQDPDLDLVPYHVHQKSRFFPGSPLSFDRMGITVTQTAHQALCRMKGRRKCYRNPLLHALHAVHEMLCLL